MTATLARSQVEVLRHQLEQADVCGRAFVEVPRGVLAALLDASNVDEPCWLCCACGAIRPARLWTFWQRDYDLEIWRPSLQGEGDPMCRCPACGWEHRDTDDGSGFYDLMTVPELLEQRAQLEAESGEFDGTDYRPEPLQAAA